MATSAKNPAEIDNEVRRSLDLVRAGAENVKADYFRLTTTYDTSGIVRERVFCYELYHQMRLLMGEEVSLFLHGEIDKHGHRDFSALDQKNPDFVLHVPGTHEGNTLVIEVKGTIGYPRSKYVADFNNLITFVTRYRYRAGLFLLYNHSMAALKRIIIPPEDFENRAVWGRIYILALEKPGDRCTESSLESICV